MTFVCERGASESDVVMPYGTGWLDCELVVNSHRRYTKVVGSDDKPEEVRSYFMSGRWPQMCSKQGRSFWVSPLCNLRCICLDGVVFGSRSNCRHVKRAAPKDFVDGSRSERRR